MQPTCIKFKLSTFLGLILLFTVFIASGQAYECNVACTSLAVTDDCFHPSTIEKGCRCFDGIDNDGDGKIDANDSNCASTYGLTFVGVGTGCSINPIVGSAFDEVEVANGCEANTADTQSKVVVGDVDFDGTPDVVLTSKWSGTIRVIATTDNQSDGSKKGDLKATYHIEANDFPTATDGDPCNPNNLLFEHEVAIADIDRDGASEIYAVVSNRGNSPKTPPTCFYLIGFEYDKTQSPANRLPIIPGFPVKIGTDRPGVIGIADFDGDGKAEIYLRNRIYAAENGKLLADGGGNWDSQIAAGSVAVNLRGGSNLELVCGNFIYDVPSLTNRNPALPGTLSVNTNMNAIDGMPDYFIKLHNDPIEYGNDTHSTTSVGDLDNDGFIDVVLSGALTSNTGQTAVFYWNVQKQTVSTYSVVDAEYPNGWPWGTGPINLSDVDNDAYLDVNFVAGDQLFSLATDLTNHETLITKPDWATPHPVIPSRSGIFSMTGYDFNNDGAIELVYRDAKELVVLDGKTKTPVFSEACKSHGYTEGPIIADIDGENRPDICVPCFSYPTGLNINDGLEKQAQGTLKVLSSTTNEWLPTRRIWNQANYMVTNINDDLTVPHPQLDLNFTFANGPCSNSKNGPIKPFNMFLNQSPVISANGCPVFAAPDLNFLEQDSAPYTIDTNGDGIICKRPTIELVQDPCGIDDLQIRFRFYNSGDIPITGTIPVSYFSGDPRIFGATRLYNTTVNLSNVAVGDSLVYPESGYLSFKRPTTPFTLYVILYNDGSTLPLTLAGSSTTECDISDNIYSVTVPGVFGTHTVGQDHFTISWPSIQGVDQFLLDVSTDPTFSTLLPGYDKKQIAASATSHEVTGLNAGTIYYFRYYVEVNSSLFPQCEVKQQITIPATPTLDPITSTTSNGFTATWNTVTGASFYEIDISADNFLTFFPGYEGKRLENLNGPNISVTLNELSAGTGYSVRVRAGNTAGISPNSSVQTFSTSGAFTPLSVSVTENSATEIKGSPVEVKFLVKSGIGDLSIQSIYSGLTSEESYPVCNEQRGDSIIVLVEEYMFEEADVEVTVVVTDALEQEAEASTVVSNLYMAVDEPRIIISPPYPNPASDQVLFRVNIPENSQQSPIMIHIVDLIGRRVQSLNESASGVENQTITWDRTDSQGNIVLPGVYLARISVGFDQAWYRVIIK